MQALSGLTPALSRRLQRQLLAHLPPQAAARLRRTLSLHAAKPAAARPPYARSHSASKSLDSRSPDCPATKPSAHPLHPTADNEIVTTPEEVDSSVKAEHEFNTDIELTTSEPLKVDNDIKTPKKMELPSNDDFEIEVEAFPEGKSSEKVKPSDQVTDSSRVKPPEVMSVPSDIARFKTEDALITAPQYCTLPRLRRRSTLCGESLSPASTPEIGYGSAKSESLTKESGFKSDSMRHTPDRPLLSKYLAPERNLSLDESYSSDSGSILSEPSYIAAYGSSAINNTSGLGFRRHSLRLTGDQSKKRISRFLRSDFFDTSVDDSIYAKHKKEKELETQKILKEIRDKKNKHLESTAKSPIEMPDDTGFKDDINSVKKCLSPIGNLLLKDRSRSTTPFFPILDKIKESTLDSHNITSEQNKSNELNVMNDNSVLANNPPNKELKMIRPKSYPIKSLDVYEDTNKGISLECCKRSDNDVEDKKLNKESKLLRPKSYPTSSPSPEKVFVNRNNQKDEAPKDLTDERADVEVSFSITLPKKVKASAIQSDSQKTVEQKVDSKIACKKGIDSTLTLKKYQVVCGTDNKNDKDHKNETQSQNVTRNDENYSVTKHNHTECAKNGLIKEEVKLTVADSQSIEKKGIVKKKIVKKVSAKTKTEINASETKTTDEKKKVTKKVKEKAGDENPKTAAPKKKSVFQSIGHKLEKLASSKSNSPEKNFNNDESLKVNRTQRENSVPVNVDPPTESNLIKRAVTITDVAALEIPNISQNKTTVSKVLGLFKKFEPKEKNIKSAEKINAESANIALKEILLKDDLDSEEKPKRPTSLLLNGLGRKYRYSRTSSDDVNAIEDSDDLLVVKKENDSKNIKNSLKLDFSRLPRVKKIVPTSPVIETQIINSSDIEKNIDSNFVLEKNGNHPDSSNKEELDDPRNRSRSRSRSTYSNSELKSDLIGIKDKYSLPDGKTHHLPLRSLDSITPEKEDIVDRIRRKSFYSRFNEKKQRRKSNLVGPGATEYDPLARIHSHSNDSKYDVSPTSPGNNNYDLSPGLSVGSDVSPSTERYRSLLTDLPTTRSGLRYDGPNDKIDMYRSLDRNDFRKHPGRSYLDYDQTSSYSPNRYSRTKSLFDSSDNSEDHSFGLSKESYKYNRANSLFSPGSYATYRPKRTRNSAIILKECEKEPSPENIMDKIRQRKISISVTRKSDSEKDSVPRSNVSPKGEGDCTERPSKVD